MFLLRLFLQKKFEPNKVLNREKINQNRINRVRFVFYFLIHIVSEIAKSDKMKQLRSEKVEYKHDLIK